ncbi:MAG: RsmB/NOP family class I SAM-dependent RNA methyltransferase [Candidatus Lokiarchaeota archaeon]|nr:RsmB/NOP family class I SAM-dependent RNA methyltransferase [Candidatus Harpocratesius repetitus]
MKKKNFEQQLKKESNLVNLKKNDVYIASDSLSIILRALSMIFHSNSKISQSSSRISQSYSKISSNFSLNINSNWIYHYKVEIIRYQNQLQYIVRKTFRGVKTKKEIPSLLKNGIFLYIAYRIRYEHASFEDLWQELYSLLPKYLIKKQFSYFYRRIKSFNWDIALKGKSLIEQQSLLFAMPSFFLNQMSKIMDDHSLKGQIKAISTINEKGLFGVFVKSNNHEKFERICKKNQIIFEQHSKFPSLFIIESKFKPILNSQLDFKKIGGYIQEIPSILSIYAGFHAIGTVNAKYFHPLMILDYCAAPGSKTRIISSFTSENDKIIAQDIHTQRVRLISSLSFEENINIIQSDGINPCFREINNFDLIFLDAPCTGSGTFHSNPGIKWRQSPNFLQKHVLLQKELFYHAFRLLKPGGIIVYSTCSMYPEENELHFIDFIYDLKPLIPVSLPSWYPSSYSIEQIARKKSNICDILSLQKAMSRFSPLHNHTAGFFIATFTKIKKSLNSSNSQ